ncbi:hypothetical protein RRX38_02510 [Pseudomonas sp. DTU_2021_1001937_2_SI_NGA_ILE_001]|uniref:hypothetical protein n=1 Tax=Pseudomonas sp. DTU_2021_1001937_2_SI_NGA_ILE_001 TaxID=3077589 RepID=UPI0028FC1688|nr:hypothetical protein [Pseudomonas sp. DTU_2021_1001937_2_SI_NGA_ILE_001]WNW10069.1 hypothetical protein RRX38_02510 [Pseudomonas sp. DTU_2021_1001937_2_SI_NGA_ILE_001]
MAIQDNGPENGYQGPAADAPDTDDGLYPGKEGDLGQEQGGDTAPLPGANEPLVSGGDSVESEAGQGSDEPDSYAGDEAEDPDMPVQSPVDEDEEPGAGTVP